MEVGLQMLFIDAWRDQQGYPNVKNMIYFAPNGLER